MARTSRTPNTSTESSATEEGALTSINSETAARLLSFIERIERLEEESKQLKSDIKDLFGEAKSAGFDVKVLRQLLRLRQQEPADVEEQETLLDIYRHAIGM